MGLGLGFVARSSTSRRALSERTRLSSRGRSGACAAMASHSGAGSLGRGWDRARVRCQGRAAVGVSRWGLGVGVRVGVRRWGQAVG